MTTKQTLDDFLTEADASFWDDVYAELIEPAAQIVDGTRQLYKHYGPGPHPGTGTEQAAHAGSLLERLYGKPEPVNYAQFVREAAKSRDSVPLPNNPHVRLAVHVEPHDSERLDQIEDYVQVIEEYELPEVLTSVSFLDGEEFDLLLDIPDGALCSGMYQSNNGRLLFNIDALSDPQRYKKGIVPEPGFNSVEHPHHTIHHELGHVFHHDKLLQWMDESMVAPALNAQLELHGLPIDSTLNREASVDRLAHGIWRSSPPNLRPEDPALAELVSKYAKSEPTEAVAEIYASLALTGSPSTMIADMLKDQGLPAHHEVTLELGIMEMYRRMHGPMPDEYRRQPDD